ncbi:MAG: prepilin-type N-terminal cleavage/methylation domain-containing protein [Planctomycetaceae bacterium]|nr:prepilin-type N-terminal cleavage/methylation domain-containing protein [Planctomycetales bacterium]MCB9941324.1 prepilin-type N-terminal cleavage/methylation domain-containing protein [Planctomycetaceae bacterium]
MRARRTTAGGFTLVELVVVVLIIAILAAITFPKIINQSTEAQIAASSYLVENVRTKIEEYWAINGGWPTTVDPAWFQSRRVINPFEPAHPNPLYLDNDPNKYNLQTKYLAPNCSIWYNRANGSFAIRVPRQRTDAETLALYNLVNKASCPSLSYTGQ